MCMKMSRYGGRMTLPPWPHHHDAPSRRLEAVSDDEDTVADSEKETISCWPHWTTWITPTLKLTLPLDFPVSEAKTLHPPFVQVGWRGFPVTWDCKHNPLENSIHLLVWLDQASAPDPYAIHYIKRTTESWRKRKKTLIWMKIKRHFLGGSLTVVVFG